MYSSIGDKVENFVATGPESFKEWRGSDSSLGLTSDVEDALLSFLHASDVLLEGDLVFSALGGVESEEVSDLGSVGGVFVDTEFKILGELLVEFLVVFLVFGDLSEHLKALLDNVLLHDLKDLVLLEGLTRDVEWKILRVDNTLDEGEPVWDDILTVVRDKDSSNVEFDVVLFLLGFKEIEWSSLWNEKKSAEFKRTFNVEVLESKVCLPIVAEALVEVLILLFGNVFWLSHPDWLNLIKGLHFICDFLNFLGLFLLWLVILDLFDLRLIFFAFLLFFIVLLFVVLRVSDFLVGGLFNLKLD